MIKEVLKRMLSSSRSTGNWPAITEGKLVLIRYWLLVVFFFFFETNCGSYVFPFSYQGFHVDVVVFGSVIKPVDLDFEPAYKMVKASAEFAIEEYNRYEVYFNYYY